MCVRELLIQLMFQYDYYLISFNSIRDLQLIEFLLVHYVHANVMQIISFIVSKRQNIPTNHQS